MGDEFAEFKRADQRAADRDAPLRTLLKVAGVACLAILIGVWLAMVGLKASRAVADSIPRLSCVDFQPNITGQIVGIVKNEGKATAAHVKVVFTLFDANGRQVGTATARTDHLGPGDEWAFNASTREPFDSCELAELKAY